MIYWNMIFIKYLVTFKGKKILVTGGSGSIGKELVKKSLTEGGHL